MLSLVDWIVFSVQKNYKSLFQEFLSRLWIFVMTMMMIFATNSLVLYAYFIFCIYFDTYWLKVAVVKRLSI